MRQIRAGLGRKGFALPTVLIASIVLLTVLAVAVSATTAVRTVLVNQYYAQLAQVAGEAGTAYAKSCLAANGNVPQWTDAKPLTPATDCFGNVQLTAAVKALVVAGGGSGGGSTGGGGGAGGVLTNDSLPITSGTSYPITIGAGGAVPGNQATGRSGGNSIFSTLTAIGGGGGGYSNNGTSGGGGLSGGSGGGGQNYFGSMAAGSGTAGQGFAGGPLTTTQAGSGGGGAGGLGLGGSVGTFGGNGGPGILSNITGANVYYASGGGGGNGGIASSGGGSNGVAGAATNATPNTGGGGGGGYNYAGGNGGAGGSGIVVIAYPNNGNISATGGTITTSGLYKIHTFTTTGQSFSVTTASASSCPSDPRCSVTVNGDVRSSFKVGLPTLDADGKAVSIPNTGYVEVTRTSNGSVWRTYTQPSVQAAVVPDLCSGAATSALGWNNAVRAATQDNFGPTSSAQTITSTNSAVNAGYIFFRKDFAVTDPGTYNVSALTPSSSQAVDMYVDGTLVTTADGSLSTGTTTLTTGCHTVIARFTNQTVAQQAIRFTASVQKAGKTLAAVSTDNSWRVSAGDTEHYTQTLYYADPSVWTPVRVYAASAGFTPDLSSGYITTNHSFDGSNNYPSNSYAFFRDNRTVTVATPTPVTVNTGCDDTCVVYLDGEQIIADGNNAVASTTNITLQPGDHKFGERLFNVSGVSGFWLAVLRTSDGAVLSQSDNNWTAANFWTTTANQEYYSYDSSFLPSPSPFPSAAVSVLAVGGGGGGGNDMGGGGGGGGVVYNAAYQVNAPINVTVGNGGAGSPVGQASPAGSNGGNTIFGSITAFGGGGGGSNYQANTSPPGNGGSGGGASTSAQTTPAIGIVGQGNKGGQLATPYYPGGGGGAGGPGVTGPATGGIGVSNPILGPAYYWGGGGGGSGYTTIGGNGGNGGGGGGAVGVTTGGAGLNPGSPGGGGPTVAHANTPGGNAGANTGGGGGGGGHYDLTNPGGNGGSGIVVISVQTGSMTIVTTGATVSTVGINTVYTFLTSGTFTIVSVP